MELHGAPFEGGGWWGVVGLMAGAEPSDTEEAALLERALVGAQASRAAVEALGAAMYPPQVAPFRLPSRLSQSLDDAPARRGGRQVRRARMPRCIQCETFKPR